MKNVILYTLTIFCAFLSDCKGQARYKMFPSKAEILNDKYLLFDNFFPIAAVDLTGKGIKDTIPIVYVSFDPDIVDSLCFPKNDNQDGFTFEIDNTGKLLPLFNENAFKIGARFEQYFILGQEKYKQALTRQSELKNQIGGNTIKHL
jgi:hypothetical protein